ncbi:Ammonium Transporter (Amt) Family [Phytophthora cinnamomi]|uniref:Ammonium Transporter (Amt) Family n=1 Tax=Phytophthora cinnamomi TaxID=4785 RepID=UPI00355A85BD|nr:Ammonium Transporter (Amt) Family [Phytophthora cinnamomi]
MNGFSRVAFLATLVVVLISIAAAQGGSGSDVKCLDSQYLDAVTSKCVNYKSQGEKAETDYGQAVDSGNTAWMLVSSALVMIMTPGVAFFYAGLAGEEMASNTIMMSFVSMALVSIQFWAFGYSVAFGSNGMLEWAAYDKVGQTPSGTYGVQIPHLLYAFFQTQFAMITPALLSGGIVGRMKYNSFLIFILLWTTLVYDPLAHWMWSLKLDGSWKITAMGWEGKMGSLDFAGGTVIHISSGFGALAAALMVGKRYNHAEPVKPHNVPLVMIGLTLLWFGWFGFNAGSEGAADGIAATAAVNTHLASCAGFLTWVGLEFGMFRKFDPCGAASGAVAGLVAITPACGYVYPWASVIFGIVGALTGFAAVQMKNRLRYDDTLDSFGIHGCGGFVGGLMTGLFATSDVNPNIEGGALYGNGIQFVHQLVSQCVAAGYSFVVTIIILYLLKITIGLRVDEEGEVNGIDVTYHGGLAYDYRPQDHVGPAMKVAKRPSSEFALMVAPVDPL